MLSSIPSCSFFSYGFLVHLSPPSPETTRSVSNFISSFVYRIVACLRKAGFRRLTTRHRTIRPMCTYLWRCAIRCARQPLDEPELSREYCDFKRRFARLFRVVLNGFLLRICKAVFNREKEEEGTRVLGSNISDTIGGGIMIYSISIVIFFFCHELIF